MELRKMHIRTGLRVIAVSIVLVMLAIPGWSQQEKQLADGKYRTGDQQEWAKPEFDDSGWTKLSESGEPHIQAGSVWYRYYFSLPWDWKSEDLKIDLGETDAADQLYLNGQMVGSNGQFLFSNDPSPVPQIEPNPASKSKHLVYILPEDDYRLLWDKTNVLAIRLKYPREQEAVKAVRPLLSKDSYLLMNIDSIPLEKTDGDKVRQTIVLKNRTPHPVMKGTLNIEIIDGESRKTIQTEIFPVNLGKDDLNYSVVFEKKPSQRVEAIYTFTDEGTGYQVSKKWEFPYILTPKQGDSPRVNGPKMFGVRPGAPFLFRIPASGEKPMTYAAANLPEGLSLNPVTGIISGSVERAEEYIVTLTAKNSKGTNSRELTIKVGNQIALTPSMGWNSWNCYHLGVTEEKVKANADMLVKLGLADHGYTYINMDDGWEAPERDAEGRIVGNKKFTDMKGLTDYIHGLGLKAGLYSSPGPQTCGRFLGSYLHEESDAQTFAEWGFDYLKYDWCLYEEIAKDHSVPELKKPYIVMRDALDKVNRDIVYSMCQYGMGNVWEWGGNVGGNSWRITGDIEDFWERVYNIGFNKETSAPYSKPGNWNDPDMLVVGWLGFGKMHTAHLTPSEQYTHISLWALLSAPLIIGCDLTRLDDFTMNLLINDEVIAIDQDPLGKAALPVVKTDQYQVLVKELEDGSKAVGLFNLTENNLKITAGWDKLGIQGKQKVRDLWRQKDVGVFDNEFESLVPPHGVVLVRVNK